LHIRDSLAIRVTVLSLCKDIIVNRVDRSFTHLQCPPKVWRQPVTFPLSHQTALPQRLYSVLKPCQLAVGSPRNTPKNIIFASYSVYTTSSQRPNSVHMTFPQRLYSVHNVFPARKQLLQRVHCAHTARSRRAHGAHTTFSRRAHSVLKAIIAFKIFYFFIFILSNSLLQT